MRVIFLVNRITIAGEPMGVMQLASIANNRGWEGFLVEAVCKPIQQIRHIRPDLLSISIMSGDYTDLKSVVNEARAEFPDLPIIVGGPHPTFAPEIVNELDVNGVCIGEGELAFTEVLERLEQGSADFSGILNIQTKRVRTNIRPLVANLDDLPFIDRKLLYERSPWKYFKLRSFYTSRGCPYNCSYCFNHAYKRVYQGLGQTYRKRSVDNVLEEISQVTREYRTEFIRFSDDVFLLRHDQWLEDFSSSYSRQVGIPYYCLIKSDIVDRDVVKLLKESGCVSVCMSIETASETLRNGVLNRKGSSNEQIIKAFNLFNEAGIHIYTNSMLGLPHSTLKDELDTIDLYTQARPKCGLFTICVPYPGTELHSYCKEHGLLDENLQLEDMNRTSGDYSMLNQFSPRDKIIQKNISLLGGVAVAFPRLKKLITKHLIYWPENKLFFIAYYLMKNYLFSTYIVPIKFSVMDYLRLGIAALRNDAIMFITRKRRPYHNA